MQIQPYLFFDGSCEEALEFYRKALDARLEMLMRYKDSPEPGNGKPPPGDKVMHACIKIGESSVMASDGYATGKPSFAGFSLAVTAHDDAQAKRFFGALADGGKVTQPLIETFFASSFGMVTDKFGIIHVAIGKVSFSEQALGENLSAVVDALVRAKPSAAKGQYLRTAYLSTTMGPSVPIDVREAAKLTVA